MIIHSHKLPWILRISAVVLLMVLVLVSCGTTERLDTPTPITPPSATSTSLSESAPGIPEPTVSEAEGGILRPPVTPAPTLTPGVVAELISEFTHTQGLEEITVFQIRVEDWLNLGYSIFLILIIGVLLSRLVIYILTRIAARTETKYDDLFIGQIRTMIYVIMITFGFQVGIVRLELIGAEIKLWISRLYTLIYVIAATVILWRLVDVLVKWYQNEVRPKRADPQQVDTLLLMLQRVARVLLITISMIMILSLYNVNVTALIAALGVGGLALSLAAQDTLSNVISGIMIMIDQPFRVGDRIEIPKMNTWGDVVDIGLRSTRIRTRDNRLVIVPNNTISTDQVINYTFPDPKYRIQIEIGVGYGQDVEKIRQIIVDTVRQVEGVLTEKPVDALYVTMGESAMIFRVRWWIESYVDTRYMFDRVNTALQRAFDEAEIELAFNTIDVNILNKFNVINNKSRHDDE